MEKNTFYMDSAQKIQELEKAAEFFQQIADNTFDWEIFRDAAGRILYVNKAFERITGYKAEELLNGTVTEISMVHPGDAGLLKNALARSSARETIDGLNFRIIRKDGEIRYVNLCSIPVYVENDFTGTRTSIRDITKYHGIMNMEHADLSRQDLETRLTHSYKLLEYIIEHDNSAIAVLNREFKYVYVSKRFLDDYNVKEKDILGKSHYEVFPTLPEEWRTVHQRALAGETLSSDEDSFTNADGELVWVRWECRPWYEFNENIGGIILYSEVITKQKETEFDLIKAKVRAEESEKSLSNILSKLNESQHIAKIGSWDWNIITDKSWWSDELYNIYEVDPSSYVPTPENNARFVHPDDSEPYKNASIEALKTGNMLDFQLRIITHGKTKHCRSMATVHFDNHGKPVRMTGTFIDITHQVEIMNELNSSKEKAEESDKLKTAFLQNISHEVRTPLNSIVGFSELLSEPGQSLQKIKSFSKIISVNSNKLIGIISDVIEIAEIHSRQIKLVMSKFDVISLLYKVTDSFMEITQLKGIDLLVDINIPGTEAGITSDKGKLEKIFFHLVDNAVKFTRFGSIRINMKFQENNLLFSISDTGIGIPPDMQKIIFDPFRQLETGLNRSYGGTGLGLTIVKAYVDVLKGKISLSSEVDKGTVIDITIPVTIDKKERIVYQKPAGSEPINTILIAEDEYSNFKYLYEVLASENIKILHANNGQEAIEICKDNDDIDMILMDLKMPIMDGTSAARQIREFKPHIPIIAQTAYVYNDEKLSNVFDDLITKPINRNDLKQKMSRFININA
jgi:PAS domain S-box-containing protein